VRLRDRRQQDLARRPWPAVRVLADVDLRAAATPLLEAHDPVNMRDTISKEGPMAEGKVHVEIVYCVV
jgi:hypothetical protein